MCASRRSSAGPADLLAHIDARKAERRRPRAAPRPERSHPRPMRPHAASFRFGRTRARSRQTLPAPRSTQSPSTHLFRTRFAQRSSVRRTDERPSLTAVERTRGGASSPLPRIDRRDRCRTLCLLFESTVVGTRTPPNTIHSTARTRCQLFAVQNHAVTLRRKARLRGCTAGGHRIQRRFAPDGSARTKRSCPSEMEG